METFISLSRRKLSRREWIDFKAKRSFFPGKSLLLLLSITLLMFTCGRKVIKLVLSHETAKGMDFTRPLTWV